MILNTIAASTRIRVEKRKFLMPPAMLKEKALAAPKGDFCFEKALATETLSFICEVKKASPSKGLIAPVFPYLSIAREYEQAGAAAISVLTEPEFFRGEDRYLTEIKEAVKIPVLRKDFTVDSYQIYEAKLLGADAVLVICSLHTPQTIAEYLEVCNTLGLSALVEAHTEAEIKNAVDAGARVIGVNNRDLKSFRVDTERCVRLRELVPSNILFVAESGIQNADDVRKMRQSGADAVLIGETLMRAPDKKRKLEELRCGLKSAD